MPRVTGSALACAACSAWLLLSACVPRGPAAPPAAQPMAMASVPAFPPMPKVTGRLALRVVHPPDGALVVARDSTFILGSVGTGDAHLAIDGVPVTVNPNGSFLAWVPMPRPDAPAWQLLLTRGSDTVRAVQRVRLPARPLELPDVGPLVVDSSSLTPRSEMWRWPEEPIRVGLRAPANAVVTVRTPAGNWPLRASAAAPTRFAGDVPARALTDLARVVATRGTDSVSLPLRAPTVLDRDHPILGVVGTGPSTLPDTDRVTTVKPIAGGTYKWFLLPGTTVRVTGRTDDHYRIALDDQLDGWVDVNEVKLLEAGSPAPARVAGNARLVAGDGWTDLVIPMASAPPWAVDVTDEGLELTLYGTVANTDIVNHATRDTLVSRVRWEQLTRDRARFVVATREPPFGYLVRYERGAFVLRVRATPRIDPQRPLAGLTIAVDAGHPPAGSTGPTGLYEPVATLPIAERVRRLLEARGASVVMTRTGPAALGLAERPVIARRANAHAFVSIHLNALPDGVNPEQAHGTGTYWFSGHSVALARHVQAGMVRAMGLRDLGTNYDNLAVLRPTWMPAVLCEGAFVIVPEQEAWLRTPEFQEAYASGVVAGLEAWAASLGSRH